MNSNNTGIHYHRIIFVSFAIHFRHYADSCVDYVDCSAWSVYLHDCLKVRSNYDYKSNKGMARHHRTRIYRFRDHQLLPRQHDAFHSVACDRIGILADRISH